jgi:PAS domain S-box-containing protein
LSGSSNGGQEQAYRALRESEELHRVTLGEISDAVFLTDDSGLFTFVCPNVNVIFGYLPDEVRAKGRIGALLGEGLFERAELKARGEIRNIERDVWPKSGNPRHLLIHVKTVAIREGTVLYTCRDITERHLAQEALRLARLELAHASRLALVGQLMGSIAHEVNQPLTAIIANADAGLLTLDDRTRTDHTDLRGILADIRSEGELATDIVSRVRALVRKHPIERRLLDLSELAGDTLRLIASEVQRRNVRVKAELPPSLPAVEADRVSLQQVLLNLVFNAMDAMEDIDEDERWIDVRTRRVNGGVEFEVSDNGHGIPAEALERIFDPFFTTKSEGIGLGLVIAKSIVEEHRGSIRADRRASRGATFRVSLPAR